MPEAFATALEELIAKRDEVTFREMCKEELAAGELSPERYGEYMDRLLPSKMRAFAMKQRGLA